MKCANCQKEINDTAKFCRFCGTPVTAAPTVKADTATEKACPNCSKAVSINAKFCRFCGHAFEKAQDAVNNKPKDNENNSVDVDRNYVTWHVLPGQIAVKIEEKDISGYGNIRGLYVSPGTKALFFVNGKYAATLESGKYQFKDFVHDEQTEEAFKPERRHNAFANFMRNVAGHIADGVRTLFGNRTNIRDREGQKVFYTVVLLRDVHFNLLFTFDNISTANIRSNVGLHIRCKITDINGFFENNLVDQKYVSYDSFSQSMSLVVKGVLNNVLSQYSPQQISNSTDALEKVFLALRERLSVNYTYFSVVEIVELAATQEDLENIRRLKEELYIAEQELEQAQLREDFLNKMQDAEYSNMLRSARSAVDFEALMDKIDEDHLLNQDKKDQFVLMLNAERCLREARTSVDVERAINDLKKSSLLSEEEVEIVQLNITKRRFVAELDVTQTITMAALQNEMEVDREKLKWEMEIGNKRLKNQLENQKLQDDYKDSRRNADLDFQNRQMADKLDRLRQAQEIREQREQAQHKREMEQRKLEQDAALEHHRITATMSFEQIMASNPDISPAAAEALAKKYEAEAMAAQRDRTAEIYKQHDDDLKAILAQQMNLTRDVINSQNQMNANALADKQRELDRVHSDAEHHQDRMLSGMETTVNAVSRSRFAPETPTPPMPTAGATYFCQNCGQSNPASSSVCKACGCKNEE